MSEGEKRPTEWAVAGRCGAAVILLVLAAVMLARFVSLYELAAAGRTAELEDVKAIRAGIRMAALEAQMKNPREGARVPRSLEAGQADAVFENALEMASARDLYLRGWRDNGDGKTYTSPNGNTWTYEKATGEFTK